MKHDNNSYFTEETLAYLNDVVRSVYGVLPSNIKEIKIEILKEALLGWNDTKLGINSTVNYIPKWFLKALSNYIMIGLPRSSSPTKDATSVYNSVIINLLEKWTTDINYVADGETFTSIVESTGLLEKTIQVPEGFDGNYSYIQYNVPACVLDAIPARDVAGGFELDRGIGHPLMMATQSLNPQSPVNVVAPVGYGSGTTWGDTATGINTLTSQLHGRTINNAGVFYLNYTKNKRFSISTNKFKDRIVVKIDAGEFVFPFADKIANGSYIIPMIEVQTTFFKRGAQ